VGIGLIAGAAGGGGGGLLAVICLVCVLRAQRICCWRSRENGPNAPSIKATTPEPHTPSAPAHTTESSDFIFSRKEFRDERRDASAPSAPPLAATVDSEPLPAFWTSRSAEAGGPGATGPAAAAASALKEARPSEAAGPPKMEAAAIDHTLVKGDILVCPEVSAVPIDTEARDRASPGKTEPSASETIKFEYVASSIKAGVDDRDTPKTSPTDEPPSTTEADPAADPAESLGDKTKPAGDGAIKAHVVSSKESKAAPPADASILGVTSFSELPTSIAAPASIAVEPDVESAAKTKMAEIPGPVKKLEDQPVSAAAGSAMTKEPAEEASRLVDPASDQADPPTSPPVSAAALAKAEKTFSSSHYKVLYGCELPQSSARLLTCVEDFLYAVGRSKQLRKEDVTSFFLELQLECAGVSEGQESSSTLLKKRAQESLIVTAYAQRLWTCTQQMQGKELCFYINDTLRNDDKDLFTHLMPVIRAINASCVAKRGAESAIPRDVWPAGGLCYRGGELPKAHHGFYSAGRKYRVPGFLATSLKQKVAVDFIQRQVDFCRSDCVVLWIIKVPQDCAQVNFVQHSNVDREQEFLFAPYSVFTVLSVKMSSAPSESDPHRVFLSAAEDNRSEPEDLPLAPWF